MVKQISDEERERHRERDRMFFNIQKGLIFILPFNNAIRAQKSHEPTFLFRKKYLKEN